MKQTIQCLHCGIFVEKEKKDLNQNSRFCNQKCYGLYRTNLNTVFISCNLCGKPILKQKSELAKSKTGKFFCNHHCSATYNNTHKTTGTRRSKLEAWLEVKLRELYPEQSIIFNGKQAINSELDIYFVDLKLAFELNGIFHYEAIYGEDKLIKIQNNDCRKFQACLERGIELCIIDTSSQKYVKPSTSQKFLTIIQNIVDLKLNLNQ